MCQIRNTQLDDVSPIRAIHSLSETQATGIVAGLRGSGEAWSLERHVTCDGHLYLVFSGETDNSLTVDRDASGICVSRMQGDILYTGENRYHTIDDVVGGLKSMMDSGSAGMRRRLG